MDMFGYKLEELIERPVSYYLKSLRKLIDFWKKKIIEEEVSSRPKAIRLDSPIGLSYRCL